MEYKSVNDAHSSHEFFMSIDFGTSNCVAGITDLNGNPALVELEGDSRALPTALHVARYRSKRMPIDENEVRRRLVDERRKDRERQHSEKENAEQEYAWFSSANLPIADDYVPRDALDKAKNIAFALALKDFEETLYIPAPKEEDFPIEKPENPEFTRAKQEWSKRSIGPAPTAERYPDKGQLADEHRDWSRRYKERMAAFESHYRSVIGTQSPAFKLAMVRFEEKSRALRRQLDEQIRPLTSEEELTRKIRRALTQEKESEAEESYWSQTLFDAIEHDSEVFFGNAAISENSRDAVSGFFVKSPKSFLGSDLGKEHRDFFLLVLKTIISRIKQIADNKRGSPHTGVVIGRPITFNKLRGKTGDKQALELLTYAARQAGFEKVFFFPEPLAAALTFPEELLAHSQPLLVVDVGGGTTDCVVLNPKDSQSSRVEILSVTGSRVGGTDFDQDVAWQFLMPLVGKDSLFIDGRPIPNSPFWNAISTRDIQLQRKFLNSSHEIQSLKKNAKDANLISRFAAMHQNQSQHELIRIAEHIKTQFSQNENLRINLDVIEHGLHSSFQRRDYRTRIQRQISQLKDVVKEAVDESPIKPHLLFLTGGMSASPEVTCAVEEVSGLRATSSGANRLLEVGTGLAIVATALNKEFDGAIKQFEPLGLESKMSIARTRPRNGSTDLASPDAENDTESDDLKIEGDRSPQSQSLSTNGRLEEIFELLMFSGQHGKVG